MREVEQVDHPLDRLALGALGALHAREEEEIGEQPGAAVAVAADQQVVKDGRVLEELDVLERPRDAEAGDLVRGELGEVGAVKEHPARGRRV